MTALHVGIPGGLEAAGVKAKAEIDAAAGAARSRYITIAPGQAETYLAKAVEARAYLDAGSPEDLSAWPWVRADAAAFGVSGATAATAILANQQAWVGLGTMIEEIRLTAKRAVDAAQTPRERFRIAREAVAQLEGI